jgi:hypothetical protein
MTFETVSAPFLMERRILRAFTPLQSQIAASSGQDDASIIIPAERAPGKRMSALREGIGSFAV